MKRKSSRQSLNLVRLPKKYIFFQKCTSIFFLARTLINRCQIATGRSVLGKTVPKVLTGTVFPDVDLLAGE